MKDTERIPLSHLLELMRDEETPPSKIRQYFKLHEQNSNAFSCVMSGQCLTRRLKSD